MLDPLTAGWVEQHDVFGFNVQIHDLPNCHDGFLRRTHYQTLAVRLEVTQLGALGWDALDQLNGCGDPRWGWAGFEMLGANADGY